MESKNRSNRHTFYGTTVADESRIEKRYNQVRQHRLSAFQELNPNRINEQDGGTRSYFANWRLPNYAKQSRSNSLPDSVTINTMITKMEDDTSSSTLPRPRSASFDPTTKLYSAAAENDTIELKRILESGKADPNRLYLSGIAPLHVAAAEGHLETIKLLVHYGANIDIHDAEGCSPLEFALRGAHFDSASFLIKAGAEIKKIVHGLNRRM